MAVGGIEGKPLGALDTDGVEEGAVLGIADSVGKSDGD